MTPEERSLIANCVRGEKAAWDAFVQQYSKLVYHTIRQTFSFHHAEPRDDVVDDLFQELFHSLLHEHCKKLRQFKGNHGCSLASWLRVIVARQVIDYLRKQSFPAVELSNEFPSPHQDTLDTTSESELEVALTVALATLSPRDRLLVELHFRRGLGTEKVAALLRTSVGAFYAQKSRVLAKLRESLAKTLSM